MLKHLLLPQPLNMTFFFESDMLHQKYSAIHCSFLNYIYRFYKNSSATFHMHNIANYGSYYNIPLFCIMNSVQITLGINLNTQYTCNIELLCESRKNSLQAVVDL